MTAKETDEEFVREYTSLVVSIATKVQGQFGYNSDKDELIAAGYEGLVQARSRYDSSRGVPFTSFAYYRIRGAMIDALRASTPYSRRAYLNMKAAEAALEVGDYISEQKAAELKAAGTVDRAKTVKELHSALAQVSATFVLATVGQEDDGDVDEKERPETILADREEKKSLRVALAALPERERKLIEGHYLEDRRFDLVAKELGISKSWASRLHYKALERLRSLMAAADMTTDEKEVAAREAVEKSNDDFL